MVELLAESLQSIVWGVFAGIGLGALWTISRRLWMIYNALDDIRSMLRRKL